MKVNLEYRMYGCVPYNISEIQKGIQFGHAVVEYQLEYGGRVDYKKWSQHDKTFIILNGGTTRETEPVGYMQQLCIAISGLVNVAKFYEPDLNDTLSAFVFLVDERVYDKVKYPDYVSGNYIDWVTSIGGPDNVRLREILSTLRLA